MEPTTSWPAITKERLEWVSRRGPVGMTRRERMAASITHYEAAVPPLIAASSYRASPGVAADLEDAAAAIARFDAESGANVAPYFSLMLRGESAASSTIENLTSSARNIALAEVTGAGPANARIVAANTAAMRTALAQDSPVTGEAILAMHRSLMADDPHHEAGVWRSEPVWIGGTGASPFGATFVAPASERIPELVDDLVAYLARPDVPGLQQAALAHAQFETIHPFTDGNGRTGRALIHAHLRAIGLTRHVAVPISAGLLQAGPRYVEALTSYRDGEPEPLLELFASAAHMAVENGRHLARDVAEIRNGWITAVTARPQSRVWEVLDLLARQPIVTPALIQKELGIGPTHVSRYMDVLKSAGVVSSNNVPGQRNIYWRAQAILDALDDFAIRSGRRPRI